MARWTRRAARSRRGHAVTPPPLAAGASVCTLCSLGSYSDSTGALHCARQGVGIVPLWWGACTCPRLQEHKTVPLLTPLKEQIPLVHSRDCKPPEQRQSVNGNRAPVLQLVLPCEYDPGFDPWLSPTQLKKSSSIDAYLALTSWMNWLGAGPKWKRIAKMDSAPVG